MVQNNYKLKSSKVEFFWVQFLPGFEPGTFRSLCERSTTALVCQKPGRQKIFGSSRHYTFYVLHLCTKDFLLAQLLSE